jgi:hypothetical protein
VSYRVTVRRGPNVSHEDWDTLEAAIAAVTRHVEDAPGRRAVETFGRRFEPGDQVAARIELKAQGVRAGVDVRGDGTLVAWQGRVFRKPLPGDDALKALRQSVSVEP